MPEADYDRAVLAYVIDHRPGEEVMRDLALIERLYDALTRLRDRLSSVFRNDHDRRASKDALGRLMQGHRDRAPGDPRRRGRAEGHPGRQGARGRGDAPR